MDALTHCIETFLSPLVNPPAEAIALDGAARAAASLERAVAHGTDRRARWDMMMASMEGALTFQKGLGAVHGMAHPLGALPGLPLHHGTLNAVLLPAVLRYNGPAVPAKLARLRSALGLGEGADVAAWVAGLKRAHRHPGGPRRARRARGGPAADRRARGRGSPPRRRTPGRSAARTTSRCSRPRSARASSSAPARRPRTGAARTRRSSASSRRPRRGRLRSGRSRGRARGRVR